MSHDKELDSIFDRLMYDGKLDEMYSEYIMEHCRGDRLICNGDTLITAMEDGYLLDDFREYWKLDSNNYAYEF